ncbi:Homeodomain-like protein [Cynara cardunculus var. scolymus]|uniref:Homeodomain-like protein n=1 Tax=Cynara cardunculus var. scolymus TaxID=59895 RepID=A0A103XTH5_CYNCS|nr:Homeodomain-like protein [Cynara cardunculus var. scolymus]
MSRTPYFDKNGKRKGPWSKEEDDKLRAYIERYGHWNWREIPRWSTIAAKLPGRSDNEIKNYWNSHLRKRSKQDQNVLKNVHDDTPRESNQTKPTKNSMEDPQLGEMDELEALWASLSSETSFADTHEYPYVTQSSESRSISSYSSSAELTSSMFSISECLVSSGDSAVETYGGEYDGNFWTDPIFPDYNSTRSTEYSSDLDVANGLVAPAACHDYMAIGDEFLWSTMDLYSQYHSQFMK